MKGNVCARCGEAFAVFDRLVWTVEGPMHEVCPGEKTADSVVSRAEQELDCDGESLCEPVPCWSWIRPSVTATWAVKRSITFAGHCAAWASPKKP